MMPIRKSLTLSLMGPALVWAQDIPLRLPRYSLLNLILVVLV